MRNFLMYMTLFMLTLDCFGQTKAVTDKGEEVILYDNGTWKSLEKKTGWETRLDTLKFTKPASSKFLVKSSVVDNGIWLDPKVWQFKKGKEGDAMEYKFTLTGQDAYAMFISERTQIPLNTLEEVALKNAVDAAPDAKLIKQEVRNINGLTVYLLQMEGTISGINFVYYGYYYSDENGTVQFVTYTAKNLLKKYLPEMESLLNGFVKL